MLLVAFQPGELQPKPVKRKKLGGTVMHPISAFPCSECVLAAPFTARGPDEPFR